MAVNKSPERIKAAEAALKRKREANTAAAKQAYKDALVKPEDPEEDIPVGGQMPLHLLNVRNRKIDRELKNANLDASKAAARAVHETLVSTGQDAAKRKRAPKKTAGKNTAGTTVAAPPKAVSSASRPRPAAETE